MKKMIAVWLFLFLGLLGTLYFIGINYNKAYKDYHSLESDMIESASLYISTNKLKIKMGDKLTIKDSELKDNNLLPEMTIKEDECKGYIEVKKTYDDYEYNPYIKCEKYTTIDYKE